MGQRVNYILKKDNSLKIYYHHWRANIIAYDLYLGEQKFIEFVKSCKQVDELISEPWIEGCVLVDFDTKTLSFWYWELPRKTSVENYYLSKLSEKWQNWNVRLLKNRMYGIEKLISYDYINHQTFDYEDSSIEDLENDKVEDWVQTLVIFKDKESLFTTKIGSLNIEKIISLGKKSIPILKQKTSYNLENETESQNSEVLIIDLSENKIYSNECNLGLWEKHHHLWEYFTFQMGDYGLVEILKLADIVVPQSIYLSEEEVLYEFSELVKTEDDFDPNGLAEGLKKEMGNDIEFNPDFFENPKPQTNLSLLQRIKKLFK